MTWMHWAALVPVCLWGALLLLPWRPWSTREQLDAGTALPARLDDVVALVPARDEAQSLAPTLAALIAQGEHLKVVVVDDESRDATATVARSFADRGAVLVEGRPLPPGWTGKAWAQHQAWMELDRPLVLLLDADIVLDPGLLPALRDKLLDGQLALVSLMAQLSMSNPSEKLLMPPFVYFFKLIYPFALAARPGVPVAAAAGGCILLRRDALQAIGGFESLHDTLIDDCALARQIKQSGLGIWVGLTHSVHSRRRYGFADVWRMVRRTAFTQLRYSILALLVCTVLMLAAFVLPLGLLLVDDVAVRILAGLALAVQGLTYVPILNFYGRSPLWCLSLSAAALLYLSMTWASALRYWRGERSSWRGRTYVR